ncbi:GNAT family N-acetyltransferase [Lentibacillus salicampi]|uniref:N-acetyltransferase n=1 Tax=Lentibacillus salicampi TaxID=175306 RepID=A0A4Y9A960_9BACI|nr:GNAT family protein [Lentibacillus salicampi]TFJ92408.1 N-acetyltransferase [Lentibacillus salicampi]
MIQFAALSEPTPGILKTLNRWENDTALQALTRPVQSEVELTEPRQLTMNDLTDRLKHENIYLIYMDDQLIGEMSYMIDPGHLYKKEPGTAWIGIVIGETKGRGNGIGYDAMKYLEEQIKKNGIKRIELGVFAFNRRAHRIYQKLGYQEIGRIEDFTSWQGEMWPDIRMEKYLGTQQRIYLHSTK